MSNEAENLPTQGRYSAQATELIKRLDARIEDVFQEIQKQPFWQALIDSKSSDALLKSILREVMLAIYWYQKHTTEAGFHMIGKLPKTKTENTLQKLTILHKVEESEHNEWALRDFELLGGDVKYANAATLSPATFAVTGIWWRMAVAEEPFGYFGAEYLFEYLTMIVTQPLVRLFKQRGFKAEGWKFIIDHATEDEKHAKLIRHLICDVVTRHPESEAAMLRCFDYFRHVYPVLVWTEAYQRAVKKIKPDEQHHNYCMA